MKISNIYGFEIDASSVIDGTVNLDMYNATVFDGEDESDLTQEQIGALKALVAEDHLRCYGVAPGEPYETKTATEVMDEIRNHEKEDEIMFGLLVLNRPLSEVSDICLFKPVT